MSKKRQILAAAVIVGMSALPLYATDYTWNGGGADANWSTIGNWDLGAVPTTGDSATFQGATQTTVNVDGTQSINTINFTDANAFTLNGGTINLDDGGSINKASTSDNTQFDVINAPINFLGGATISDSTGGGQQNYGNFPIQLNGTLSGSGLIQINGTSYGVAIGADNSGFTGSFQVNSGGWIIPYLSDTALGSATSTTTLTAGSTVAFTGTSHPVNNWVITGNARSTSYINSTASGNFTIDTGATFTMDQGGGNGLNLSGVISGGGNISLTGGGLQLSGSSSNTLTGQITESSGSGNSSFRATTLNKTGGAIAIAGPLTLTNNAWTVWQGDEQILNTVVPVLSGAGTAFHLNGHTQTLGGLSDGGLTGGTVSNELASTTAQLKLATSSSSSFSGILADIDPAVGTGGGQLALTVSGTGSQTLGGANTYTGTTSITGGTLVLAPTGTLGNTAITVAGGTFAPRGGSSAGALGGNASLTLASNGIFDMTGDNGANLGAFTLNPGNGFAGTSLTLGGGALKFDLGSTLGSNDSLVVASGSSSVSGLNTLTINTAGDTSLGYGDYTLIQDSAGGLVPANFQFDNNAATQFITVNGTPYELSLANSTATSLVLTVGLTGPANSMWKLAGAGDWNVNNNWTTGTPNSVDAVANFVTTPGITASHTVYTDTPVTVGTINFDNPNTYVLAGAGSLTLQVSDDTSIHAQVNVQQGTQKINLPLELVSNTDFNVASGATLKVSDPMTVDANKSLSTTGSGTILYESTVTLQSGATMSIANSTHAAGLSIAATAAATIAPSTGTPTLVQVDQLSVDPTGKLDVNNNELLVHNGNLSTITSEIASGFSAGSWSGNGISSTAAHDDATYLHAVGVAQSGSDVVVKYSWYGDADLSGHVDGTDYSMIDVGFNSHGSLTGWGNGDFNYDGLIDGSDYSLIDNAFNMQGLPIANAASQIAVNTAEISGASAVPEPGSISLLVLGAAGLLGKRRRRK